jgi:hypothetical protein
VKPVLTKPTPLALHRNAAAAIRRAVNRNLFSGGPAVYAKDATGLWARITDARERKGELHGKSLNTGKWFVVQAWEVRI